ncbi:hypothetical protein BDV06DRAFT_187395 [Aspergillus oleicola]
MFQFRPIMSALAQIIQLLISFTHASPRLFLLVKLLPPWQATTVMKPVYPQASFAPPAFPRVWNSEFPVAEHKPLGLCCSPLDANLDCYFHVELKKPHQSPRCRFPFR